MLDYLIVIPARYKSVRLPGKPLIKISGVPMLVRTFKKCLKCSDHKKIIVATDNKKIERLCKKEKINYIQTSSKCLTGTDRVAEVAKKIKAKVYINVQADEPLLVTADLLALIRNAKKFPNKIFNGFCSLKSREMFFNRNTIKVVVNKNNKLLYISRAPIPNNKRNIFKKAWRQVCIYSFPRQILLKFSKFKNKSNLESVEDIEILRFLEIGLDVHMLKMSSKSVSVDTLQDLKKVEKILNK